MRLAAPIARATCVAARRPGRSPSPPGRIVAGAVGAGSGRPEPRGSGAWWSSSAWWSWLPSSCRCRGGLRPARARPPPSTPASKSDASSGLPPPVSIEAARQSLLFPANDRSRAGATCERALTNGRPATPDPCSGRLPAVDLEGKRVLLSGATGGLGRAIAEALAGRGREAGAQLAQAGRAAGAGPLAAGRRPPAQGDRRRPRQAGGGREAGPRRRGPRRAGRERRPARAPGRSSRQPKPS